ncbi:unnamed protein product [Moneuplotes crassus]|uniref:Uncharacterized protein n=1 Tax=Euplotes crassus TaxID=5936 RepID=A0AAD1Y5Z7_EUPCR|nr:unnamed protein product [Moneuplotes crassus]
MLSINHFNTQIKVLQISPYLTNFNLSCILERTLLRRLSPTQPKGIIKFCCNHTLRFHRDIHARYCGYDIFLIEPNLSKKQPDPDL